MKTEKPITAKEFSHHISQQARLGMHWQKLETELDVDATLAKNIASHELELERLEADVAAVKAAATAAAPKAAGILAKAEERAAIRRRGDRTDPGGGQASAGTCGGRIAAGIYRAVC